jgi:hypothetical protein
MGCVFIAALAAAAGGALYATASRPDDPSRRLLQQLHATVPTIHVRQRPVSLWERFAAHSVIKPGPAVAVSRDAPKGIVSAVLVQRSQSVAEGDIIGTVQGSPVIALEGSLPAYRDLEPGATGPDVDQLHAALLRLRLPCRCSSALTRVELHALRESILQRAAVSIDREAWKGRVPLGGIAWVRALPVTVDRVEWHVGRPASAVFASTRLRLRTVSGREVPAESRLKVGQRARVTDAGGDRWTTSVRRVEAATGGLRRFTLEGSPPARIGGHLHVDVRTLHRRGRALIVPASAVGSGADGTDHVVVLRGRQQDVVRVQVIGDLGGKLAVRGSSLRTAEEVVIPVSAP